MSSVVSTQLPQACPLLLFEPRFPRAFQLVRARVGFAGVTEMVCEVRQESLQIGGVVFLSNNRHAHVRQAACLSGSHYRGGGRGGSFSGCRVSADVISAESVSVQGQRTVRERFPASTTIQRAPTVVLATHAWGANATPKGKSVLRRSYLLHTHTHTHTQ